jgi:hypothetical protein
MPLTLKQSHIEAYLRDPVLAAWAIFGAELDVFQQVRLRLMWHVPELIDDSGISTGKTEILWLWAQLRAILLPQPSPYPHRIIGIYYPTLESAKSNFMPKYEKYLEQSEVFRHELRPMHGGKLGYQSLNGAIQWVYRNGSIVQCPAANYAQDSKNQASKRFHDVGVDEAKEADGSSQGLDSQILGRVTAPGWNNKHPVWANHVVLMGHAEDPDTHPFYRRVRAFRALIKDGSQNHAIITSSYRDWTARFQKDLRPDGMIRTARLTMTKARFRQIWEGLWEHGSEDWYESGDVRKACTRRVPVLTRRDKPSTIFAMGWDTAPGATRKADLNAGVVTAAVPLPADTRETLGVFRFHGRAFRIHPVWAAQIRGRDAGELAGIIHRANQRFGLRRIVFDPGGGGSWVQKELWKDKQFFDGRIHKVTGLCTPEASFLYPQAQPILTPFSRGAVELAPVWGEDRFRNSDEGIIEAIHRLAQSMFASHTWWWPAPQEDRPAAEFAAMDTEQRMALLTLSECLKQFLTIKVVTGPDNSPRVTKRGFLMFRADGKQKKDLAYAALYSLAAILSLLMDPEFHEDESEEGAGLCMACG